MPGPKDNQSVNKYKSKVTDLFDSEGMLKKRAEVDDSKEAFEKAKEEGFEGDRLKFDNQKNSEKRKLTPRYNFEYSTTTSKNDPEHSKHWVKKDYLESSVPYSAFLEDAIINSFLSRVNYYSTDDNKASKSKLVSPTSSVSRIYGLDKQSDLENAEQIKDMSLLNRVSSDIKEELENKDKVDGDNTQKSPVYKGLLDSILCNIIIENWDSRLPNYATNKVSDQVYEVSPIDLGLSLQNTLENKIGLDRYEQERNGGSQEEEGELSKYGVNYNKEYMEKVFFSEEDPPSKTLVGNFSEIQGKQILGKSESAEERSTVFENVDLAKNILTNSLDEEIKSLEGANENQSFALMREFNNKLIAFRGNIDKSYEKSLGDIVSMNFDETRPTLNKNLQTVNGIPDDYLKEVDLRNFLDKTKEGLEEKIDEYRSTNFNILFERLGAKSVNGNINFDSVEKTPENIETLDFIKESYDDYEKAGYSFGSGLKKDIEKTLELREKIHQEKESIRAKEEELGISLEDIFDLNFVKNKDGSTSLDQESVKKVKENPKSLFALQKANHLVEELKEESDIDVKDYYSASQNSAISDASSLDVQKLNKSMVEKSSFFSKIKNFFKARSSNDFDKLSLGSAASATESLSFSEKGIEPEKELEGKELEGKEDLFLEKSKKEIESIKDLLGKEKKINKKTDLVDGYKEKVEKIQDIKQKIKFAKSKLEDKISEETQDVRQENDIEFSLNQVGLSEDKSFGAQLRYNLEDIKVLEKQTQNLKQKLTKERQKIGKKAISIENPNKNLGQDNKAFTPETELLQSIQGSDKEKLFDIKEQLSSAIKEKGKEDNSNSDLNKDPNLQNFYGSKGGAER